ncbi:MAG: hypothetical protein ACI94Y_000646 [Maribacter sp.]|jgi:hypothetical protein
MENVNKSIFTDSSLSYLSTASNMAKLIAILTIFKIGFLFYFLFSYYGIFSSGIDSYAIRYFGSSISNIGLSIISATFLFLFANKIDMAKGSHQIEDWNNAFAFFRNYLIVFIIISINWIFFALIQFLLTMF